MVHLLAHNRFYIRALNNKWICERSITLQLKFVLSFVSEPRLGAILLSFNSIIDYLFPYLGIMKREEAN